MGNWEAEHIKRGVRVRLTGDLPAAVIMQVTTNPQENMDYFVLVYAAACVVKPGTYSRKSMAEYLNANGYTIDD